MWRGLLRSLLDGDVDHLEVVDVARSGASGPRVVFVRDKNTDKVYAVKYGETRVPIMEQVSNRDVIAPLFGDHHFPAIAVAGDMVMMMEAIQATTLHELVTGGQFDVAYIQEMYGRVLNRFGQVWSQTKTNIKPECGLRRNPHDRAVRVVQMLLGRVFSSSALSAVTDHAVVINGQPISGTIGELLAKLTQSYEPPNFYVVCHGDPNADNILIDSHRNWWLIDWEWVGTHDPRVVASHFLGWWLSNASMLTDKPSLVLGDGAVRINYNLQMSPAAEAVTAQSREFLVKIGQELDGQGWERQLNLQLATLLLGDLRFVEARGRSQYAIPLLGEGLRILANL